MLSTNVLKAAVTRRARALPTKLWVGAAIVAILIAIAALAPLIAPYPYDSMSLLERFRPPSVAHWFGTDDYGRDVLSRTLFGARLSLIIGFGATLISVVIGVPLGLVAGYKRGAIDEWMMRGADVLMSLPPIMLGLLVLAVTTPSLEKNRYRSRYRLCPGNGAHHSERRPRPR